MCERDIAANDRTARRNREQFREHGVVVVRLLGSPGAGKTALLEATSRALLRRTRIGVLAADPATDCDAVRLRSTGVEAVSVMTGTGCHLDAETIHRALRGLAWRDLDYLFIEDVGNLVCPAVYDLGQAVNVLALSVPEGADQPLKYPTIFQKADLVLLTKIDMPLVEADQLDRLREHLAAITPHPTLLPVSVRTGVGIGEWLRWVSAAGHRRGAPCAVGPVGQ